MSRYVKINNELVPIAGAGGNLNNFQGTLDQWEAMTQAQKNQYDTVDITDDYNDVTVDIEVLQSNVGNLSSLDTTVKSSLVNAINEVNNKPSTGEIDAMIAGTESSSTASQAYTAGQYIIYNNGLYKVSAAIAQGDTLTVNTNIVSATIGGELTGHLVANGNAFYFDYHDGQYGYNTSPNRGADSFVPFSSGSAEDRFDNSVFFNTANQPSFSATVGKKYFVAFFCYDWASGPSTLITSGGTVLTLSEARSFTPGKSYTFTTRIGIVQATAATVVGPASNSSYGINVMGYIELPDNFDASSVSFIYTNHSTTGFSTESDALYLAASSNCIYGSSANSSDKRQSSSILAYNGQRVYNQWSPGSYSSSGYGHTPAIYYFKGSGQTAYAGFELENGYSNSPVIVAKIG